MRIPPIHVYHPPRSLGGPVNPFVENSVFRYQIKLFTALLAVMAMAVGLEAAEVVESVAADRKELSLVIYNGNAALVREKREVRLPKGECEIRLADIGRMLIPSSVIADPGENTKLIEQRYLFDPLNRQNLLDAFVGRKVMVESKDERTGVVECKEAVLLSNGGGPVLEIDGRVELDHPGPVSYTHLRAHET